MSHTISGPSPIQPARQPVETARRDVDGLRQSAPGARAPEVRFEDIYQGAGSAGRDPAVQAARPRDANRALEIAEIVRKQVLAQGTETSRVHGRLVPSTALNLLR